MGGATPVGGLRRAPRAFSGRAATTGPDGSLDADLLSRALAGDDSAFGALVDRHANALFGLAMGMTGHTADAEDAVQETFAAAMRGIRGFEGRSSVRTWLTRILMNKLADLRRARRLHRAVPLHAATPGLARPASERRGDPFGADVRMDVSTMLARLSPEHREIVVLREMQGMSYRQIAEVLGVPPGTVESRLFRARRRLRDLLGDYLS